MAENNNNRWWEFYLARYLAANIFAVLVLFYLVAFHGNCIRSSLCQNSSNPALCNDDFPDKVFGFVFKTTKDVTSTNNAINNDEIFSLKNPFIFLEIQKDVNKNNTNQIAVIDSGVILNKSSQINITEINFANIFVLGVFGFLYMYISSIPIYFFHITRGAWIACLKWRFEFKDKTKNYNECPVSKFCRIFLSIFIFLFSIPKLIFSNSFYFMKDSTFERDKISKKTDKASKFFNGNSYESSFSPEYITSYKHEREHGNAFGIILMEILFAWLLIISHFSLWLMVPWLLLGFSGWFLGIYLEFKMVNSPSK